MMDWIEVNGAALRYELSGSGETTLVLVHEMGGTLDSWDQVMPALLPGRRVLRYDTRGAGQSEKVRGALTFDLMADDIAALLDALGIGGKVELAGCAVGAGIALRFAARYAPRVACVVAMAPATGIPAERREAMLAQIAENERLGPRGVVEQSFALSYPPEVRHDAEQYRRFRARWLANDPQSQAEIYRMLVHGTVTDDLPGIACPALMIAGTQDRLRPPSLVEPMAARMMNARFQALETGHFMAVQTPALVADAIGGFLAEQGA
jgi:pimeloyl-ACP methyl ester carboxylesterase